MQNFNKKSRSKTGITFSGWQVKEEKSLFSKNSNDLSTSLIPSLILTKKVN